MSEIKRSRSKTQDSFYSLQNAMTMYKSLMLEGHRYTVELIKSFKMETSRKKKLTKKREIIASNTKSNKDSIFENAKS